MERDDRSIGSLEPDFVWDELMDTDRSLLELIVTRTVEEWMDRFG